MRLTNQLLEYIDNQLKDGTTTVYEKYEILSNLYKEYQKVHERIGGLEIMLLKIDDLFYNHTDKGAGDGQDTGNLCRFSKIMLEGKEKFENEEGYDYE